VSESGKNDPNSPGGNGNLTRRGHGGPSTPEGKAKTKFNATTHGIFSSVVVLRGETQEDYDSLLNGLWADSQPQGKLEEILVEKLAMILWRYRRLLVSEVGEISKGRQRVIREKDKSLQEAVANSVVPPEPKDATQSERGMFWDVSNLKMLDGCVELFVRLREGIKSDGFQVEHDQNILKQIYGMKKWGAVGISYEKWRELYANALDETLRKKGPSPESCRDNMLREIDVEIERLRQIREQHGTIEDARRKFDMRRLQVPEGPGLERLLRYEASLERAFDRTMAQLERMQRMRLGQPVPPRLEVDLK